MRCAPSSAITMDTDRDCPAAAFAASPAIAFAISSVNINRSYSRRDGDSLASGTGRLHSILSGGTAAQMKHWYRHLAILFCIAFLVVGSRVAQGDAAKKSFVFHGKVE